MGRRQQGVLPRATIVGSVVQSVFYQNRTLRFSTCKAFLHFLCKVGVDGRSRIRDLWLGWKGPGAAIAMEQIRALPRLRHLTLDVTQHGSTWGLRMTHPQPRILTQSPAWAALIKVRGLQSLVLRNGLSNGSGVISALDASAQELRDVACTITIQKGHGGERAIKGCQRGASLRPSHQSIRVAERNLRGWATRTRNPSR